MREIYYVMSCDEWKSNDSMRLKMITTDMFTLKKFVCYQIRKQNMFYNGDTEKEMLTNFSKDFETKDISELNDLLEYGYIGVTDDGEEM